MGVVNFVAEFDTSRVESKVIKMNKDFDKLGASIRKYLEASRGSLDEMYSRLGDIKEKMGKNIKEAYEYIKKKFDELKNDLDDLSKKPITLEKVIDFFYDLSLFIIAVIGTIELLIGGVGALGLALLKGALIVGTFCGAFKFIDALREIDYVDKAIVDLGILMNDAKESYDLSIASASLTITEYIQNMKEVFSEGRKAFQENPIEGISTFYFGGIQTIDRYRDGMSHAWTDVKNVVNSYVEWIKKRFQLSNSPPFTIPYECGLGIMAAYSKGMNENMPLLESTLNEITTKVETGLQIPAEAFASGSLTSGLGLSADISATLDPIKDQLNDVYDHFGKVEQDAHDKSLTGWKDWGSSLTSFLDQLFKTNITEAYQTLKSGFSDLFSIFKGGGAASQGGLLGGLFGAASAEDGGLAAGGEASLSKSGGMLSKIGAALGPIGQIASVVMQIPQIVKQVWASIKDFAKSIASLFGWMTTLIKNINTHLFLFIKDNNLLQQRNYEKGIGVRARFVPVRMWRSQLVIQL